MAIPILKNWKNYYNNPHEGLGSSYERIIINNKMNKIIKNFRVKSILECPSFGFTGLSNINSLDFVLKGLDVQIVDNDKMRIELTENLLQKKKLNLKQIYNDSFEKLPFENNRFDLSWNFSALWFIKNLPAFLSELDRVTKKVIVIMVPNKTGIGYISQKYFGKDDLKNLLIEENISFDYFDGILNKLNYKLLQSDFIDCPPWPDIGMSKEKFLKRFGINLPPKEVKPLTILDYYTNENPQFAEDILRFYWFEKFAPNALKTFWAHHKYYVYIKK